MIDLRIAKITPMVLVDLLGGYAKWQKLPWGMMTLLLIEANCRLYASVSQQLLVQIVACRLVGAKPLTEPMLECC